MLCQPQLLFEPLVFRLELSVLLDEFACRGERLGIGFGVEFCHVLYPLLYPLVRLEGIAF